jgi:hypothetical protein
MRSAAVERVRAVRPRRKSPGGTGIPPSTPQAAVVDAASSLTPFEQFLSDALHRTSRANFAILISALGVVLFYLRCFAVTNFDDDEAFAVFIHSTVSNSLTAITSQLLNMLSLIFFGTFSFVLGHSWAHRGLFVRQNLFWLLLVTAQGVLTAVFLGLLDSSLSRWWFASVYIFAVVFCLLGRMISKRIEEAIILVSIVCSTVVILVDPTISGSITSRDMWTSLERYTLTSGAQIKAYYLDSREDQIYLLEEQNRLVISVPKSAVVHRIYCRSVSNCPDSFTTGLLPENSISPSPTGSAPPR